MKKKKAKPSLKKILVRKKWKFRPVTQVKANEKHYSRSKEKSQFKKILENEI